MISMLLCYLHHMNISDISLLMTKMIERLVKKTQYGHHANAVNIFSGDYVCYRVLS